MKTKIFLGCIMAASLITVSCSDLLQENPQVWGTERNVY